MGDFRYHFDAHAQSDQAALVSLQKIFAYVADHQQVIDNALVPPFQTLETLRENINTQGLAGLCARDGDTILQLVTGLQSLSAEAVPGYYNEDDFDRATVLGQKIAHQAARGIMP